MAEQKEAVVCPNCQQPATRIGNEITCEHCDAIFVVTQKNGAKVKTLGPIAALAERVDKLESLLPEAQTETIETPLNEPEKIEQGDNDNDSESDILPR